MNKSKIDERRCAKKHYIIICFDMTANKYYSKSQLDRLFIKPQLSGALSVIMIDRYQGRI